jgi:hypothetical protein
MNSPKSIALQKYAAHSLRLCFGNMSISLIAERIQRPIRGNALSAMDQEQLITPDAISQQVQLSVAMSTMTCR